MNQHRHLVKKTTNLSLFTIGHSNHTVTRFLEILKANKILCIVDVRSIPYSKYNKDFIKENLASTLIENGIDYIWMGDNLGGRRDDLDDFRGFRQDDKYDSDEKYSSGILELINIALSKTTAIMCSEEDPRNCHRHKIIAHTLLRKLPSNCNLNDIKIYHIRSSGKLEDASLIQIYFQPSLFS